MAVIKSLLAELVLCTLMLHPQAEVLPSDRLVSWVSQITLDENIDRFLLDKVEDDDICEALVDPLACDDEIGNSELSVKPPIPLHTEADMKGSDMGEPQSVESSDRIDREDILKRIAEAHVYMQTVMADEKLVKVRPICRNEHSLCTNWAVRGECENNPAYMMQNCAPSCFSCDQLSFETRCQVDPNAVDAFSPGDLNKMFENIITDPYYQQFEPVVLSRPDYAPGDSRETVSYKVGSIWMIQFNSAVSDEEADQLIELGGNRGYERSHNIGSLRTDGTYVKEINSGRTSSNTWCKDECYMDPWVQRVVRRIENITGIHETNSENLQLLRYDKDQFYRVHHDYISYQVDRPCGVRMVTFYGYLNDVEEGGGTNFPLLNLTVTPKKGRAVLWPSVLDSDPNVKDDRSDHQALPVIAGVKYGFNAWIHQRDFKGSHIIRCT